MRDHFGMSLIHHAAFDSRAQIVKFLLENGFDSNVLDYKGNSSLHYLFSRTSTNRDAHPSSVASILMKNDFLINLKNNEGRTPLMLISDYNLFDHFFTLSILRK